MNFSLAGEAGRSFRIHTVEVTQHDPDLIKQIVELDLMTFSEPTVTRFGAGLLLRHGRTFLLQADDVVIGACQVMRTWDRPREVMLFSITIRPGWRGRGLGTSFLTGVLGHLQAAGIHSVLLYVDPANTAGIRIYQDRFGFSRFHQSDGEYGVGHDRVMLRKILQPQPLAEVHEFPAE